MSSTPRATSSSAGLRKQPFSISDQACHLVGFRFRPACKPNAFLSFLRQQSRFVFWSHPGWGNAIHTKFCKTWWLNICLNLYLPLGRIFFSYKAHFMCAWDLSQQLATALTLTISAQSHLSLLLGVLQKLIWVILSMSYIALLDLHPLPLRDWLSGCKSQGKWFLHNNFQFYHSFYGQRSTLNKLGKLGKIVVGFFKSIL